MLGLLCGGFLKKSAGALFVFAGLNVVFLRENLWRRHINETLPQVHVGDLDRLVSSTSRARAKAVFDSPFATDQTLPLTFSAAQNVVLQKKIAFLFLLRDGREIDFDVWEEYLKNHQSQVQLFVPLQEAIVRGTHQSVARSLEEEQEKSLLSCTKRR